MRIKALLFIPVLLIFIVKPGAHAQDPAVQKRVNELVKRAEKAEADRGLGFAQAEAFYEEALEIAPDDASINARMGRCQLNGPQRHKALPFFRKAAATDPSMPRIHFLLGYALQLDGKWDEAIAAFTRHMKNAAHPDPEPMYNTADKHIAECRSGKALMAAPVNVQVRNAGPAVNTMQADYGPLITADGATMIFTSRRPDHAGAKVNKATGEYFENVYASRSNKGRWDTAEKLPPPVNTATNDASVGLFNDGRTLLIYRDHDGSGDLFESRRSGGNWSVPTTLGPNVNSVHHESSAWFSFDRQWLYFISDRPEGNVGGQDIYRSPWDALANTWGPAENLGSTVNSVHDEEGVFVHPDGRTLYFSSKGHNTMGGYDVFRSRLVDGKWTKPENMGWPVNSPDDDLFFVLTADGRTGYLSSFRADGLGEDDIYAVDFLPASGAMVGDPTASAGGMGVMDMEAAPSTVLIKGKIKNLHMLAGLEADIELMDLSDASLAARFQSDDATGEYMVAVPSGRDYAMYVKADGFLLRSEHIHVPTGQRGMEMELDITLEPLATGHQVTMKNLFFAHASAALESTSRADLDQLTEVLRKNSSLRLEISGHTDSDGTVAINQKLSEARANAVRDHLLKNGVDGSRIVAIGMGDTRPVAANDTDANKALNRRTEIKVL